MSYTSRVGNIVRYGRHMPLGTDHAMKQESFQRASSIKNTLQ